MLKNRKLKNFLIYPRFQLTLVAINIFILGITVVLIFTQIFTNFEEVNLIGQKLNLPADSSFFKFLEHQRDMLLTRMYWAIGISFTIAFSFIIYFSHKASGPIHRLRCYFEELKENKEVKYPLSFRDGDFYSDLPQIVNEGIESIKKD
jgi:D-alanyl-lipoteichoic acid acyltransferase DltB (MBOAT superfamily)